MDIRNILLLNSLLTPKQNSGVNETVQQLLNKRQQVELVRDKVDLSQDQTRQDTQNQNNPFLRNPNQSFLISERTENLENGFRRLQEFESLNGRQFTRIEEVIQNEDRSTRTVVQQSNSGNINVIESIFDRQEDGTFRLTQRLTNEAGDTQTNIQFNILPENRDILLGNRPEAGNENRNPIRRGSSIDLSA
ncbi:MAG: hypothetical protein AAF549_06450 [Pseudomonadota bacterium]